MYIHTTGRKNINLSFCVCVKSCDRWSLREMTKKVRHFNFVQNIVIVVAVVVLVVGVVVVIYIYIYIYMSAPFSVGLCHCSPLYTFRNYALKPTPFSLFVQKPTTKAHPLSLFVQKPSTKLPSLCAFRNHALNPTPFSVGPGSEH